MIKNLVFDVGGVLLEYRWMDMLLERGLSEKEAYRIGQEVFAHPLWTHGMDLGEMTQEEVIDGYEKLYPQDGPLIRWFITHGEEMPVARPKIWDQVGELKNQGYGIYLLSNYSQILFEKHTRDADFMNYIDGRVVSYEIHKIKPDPAIYQYLLQTYDLSAPECIFFDDRLENTQTARELGMEAVQVLSGPMLSRELERFSL